MFNVGDRVEIKGTEDIWEGLTGKVIEVSDEEIITSSGKDFTEITVAVNYPLEDEMRQIVQIFPAYVLEKVDVNESLTEDLDANFEPIEEDKDYIRDYVYLVDINDKEIPSWYFVNKIATEERLPEETVVEDAKKLNYRIFRIEAPEYCRLIVLAPKCKEKEVYREYADFLQGDAKITELK